MVSLNPFLGPFIFCFAFRTQTEHGLVEELREGLDVRRSTGVHFQGLPRVERVSAQVPQVHL